MAPSTSLDRRGRTYRWEGRTRGLVLERGLIHAERVVLRLGRDRRGRRVVVWRSTITARIAVEVVSIMKTLLGGLCAEGEGRDLGSDVRGRGAGHDGSGGYGCCELVEDDTRPVVKMTR